MVQSHRIPLAPSKLTPNHLKFVVREKIKLAELGSFPKPICKFP